MNINKIMSQHKTGKLEKLRSINAALSAACKKRMLCKHKICSLCYNPGFFNIYPDMAAKLERNTVIFTKPINPAEFKIKDNGYPIRFDSFGEIHNTQHAINYFKIAEINPKINFTLWTKEIRYINAAVFKMGKPKNLLLIYSFTGIMLRNYYPSIPKHFDGLFGVIGGDIDIDTNINCGAKKCFKCMNCYAAAKLKKHKYIFEKLKANKTINAKINQFKAKYPNIAILPKNWESMLEAD